LKRILANISQRGLDAVEGDDKEAMNLSAEGSAMSGTDGEKKKTKGRHRGMMRIFSRQRFTEMKGKKGRNQPRSIKKTGGTQGRPWGGEPNYDNRRHS